MAVAGAGTPIRRSFRACESCSVTDTFLPEVNGVTTVLAIMRDGLRRRGHEVQSLPRPTAPSPRTSPDSAGSPRFPVPGYPAGPALLAVGPRGRTGARRFAARSGPRRHRGPLGLFGRQYALRHASRWSPPFIPIFPATRPAISGHCGRPDAASCAGSISPAGMTQTPSDADPGRAARAGGPQAVVWGRGVDTALVPPGAPVRGAPRGLARRRALVLHVGRLAVEKDVETLVAAFQSATRRLGDQAVFCVAGDGPKAAEVRDALPFARHLGFLDRDTLADLYADCRSLRLSLAHRDLRAGGAGGARLRACPVIGARAGGVPENSVTGSPVLIVPGDAARIRRRPLQCWWRIAIQREAMGQAARAFAVGRDWARELDELERLCQSSVEPRAPRRRRAAGRPPHR